MLICLFLLAFIVSLDHSDDLYSELFFLIIYHVLPGFFNNICLHVTCLCNSANVQSPFEQLALPAPPVSNGSATPAPKSDLGVDLLSWDDNPSTTENSLALVPVTDPVVDSTPSQNALAIVDIFSQNNTTNNIAKPADPFGVNSSSTLPGSQPYNAPTQHPLQAQQQPQQVGLYPNGGAVNPGTSYPTSSGWNGQIANNATPPAQQTVNYGIAIYLYIYISQPFSYTIIPIIGCQNHACP